MSKYIFDLDSYIGTWGYSKRMIRNFLNEAGKKPVEIRISSLGGEVDHALDIHNQFAQHGNVSVVYSGFNASSATIIGLGANHSKIADNSFYLIHKALKWVDAWGTMNADDLDGVIEQLQKDKLELEKITLVLAKMYVDKSGKTLSEILDLMKEEKWLSAHEAVEMGFVDEVFKPKTETSQAQNEKMAQFVNYSDLPPLPTIKNEGLEIVGTQQTTEDQTENIFARLKKTALNFINSQFNMKKRNALLAVLKVENLETNDEQGTFMNDEQLDLVDQALQGITSATEQRDTAVTDLATANGTLAQFDAIDPTIAEAKTPEEKTTAIRAYMTKKPAKPTGVQGTNDEDPITDGVDWDALNALPHMQEEVD